LEVITLLTLEMIWERSLGILPSRMTLCLHSRFHLLTQTYSTIGLSSMTLLSSQSMERSLQNNLEMERVQQALTSLSTKEKTIQINSERNLSLKSSSRIGSMRSSLEMSKAKESLKGIKKSQRNLKCTSSSPQSSSILMMNVNESRI
jgi:hypothetical protein